MWIICVQTFLNKNNPNSLEPSGIWWNFKYLILGTRDSETVQNSFLGTYCTLRETHKYYTLILTYSRPVHGGGTFHHPLLSLKIMFSVLSLNMLFSMQRNSFRDKSCAGARPIDMYNDSSGLCLQKSQVDVIRIRWRLSKTNLWSNLFQPIIRWYISVI